MNDDMRQTGSELIYQCTVKWLNCYEIYFVMLKQEEEQGPAAQDHRAKHVHALVKDLFSQPLTLQELSVIATRERIGSHNLWAKIDALPVPRLMKYMYMLQLKVYHF